MNGGGAGVMGANGFLLPSVYAGVKDGAIMNGMRKKWG